MSPRRVFPLVALLLACTPRTDGRDDGPAGRTASLVVSTAGDARGRVVSAPAGIDCGDHCSADFELGTVVELTAVPEAGARFSRWSADCAGSSLKCTLAISSTAGVTAWFEPATAVVEVSMSGAGRGTVTSSPAGLACSAGTCSHAFPRGSDVTLTAAPAAGSAFLGWGGACEGGTPQCTLAVDDATDVRVSASFAIVHALTVDVAGDGAGTLAAEGLHCNGRRCTGTYVEGSVVDIVATPDARSGVAWSGCDSVEGATCRVSMDRARNVTASFAPESPLLTVIVEGNGRGTVRASGLSCVGNTCSGAFPKGSTVVLTATAALDSLLRGWDGACRGAGETCRVVMDSPKVASVVFAALSTPGVTGVAASPILQGAQVTWLNPGGNAVAYHEIHYRRSGTSAWSRGGRTSSPATTSFWVEGLLPQASYDFQVTTVNTSGEEGPCGVPICQASATTRLSGRADDFAATQKLTGLRGDTFVVTWNEQSLFFGFGRVRGPVGAGQTLYVAIDTDPDEDTRGHSSLDVLLDATGAYAPASVIWPFKADRVLAVKRGAGRGVVYEVPADWDAPWTELSSTTVESITGLGFDELSIGRADLGHPSKVRLAMVAAQNTGGAFDLAPANPRATDTLGARASVTASLAPGANVWNTANTRQSGTAAVSPLQEAPSLVTISVDRGAPANGAVLIDAGFKNAASALPSPDPWRWADYSLAVSGTVHTGRFNFGGMRGELWFAFVDDAGHEPTFDGMTTRIYTLSGSTETIPMQSWGLRYATPRTVTITFELWGSVWGVTPNELRGSVSPLSWNAGVPFTGSAPWSATLAFASHELASRPLEFKATDVGAGNWEQDCPTVSRNHEMYDDVINSRVLTWTANNCPSF